VRNKKRRVAVPEKRAPEVVAVKYVFLDIVGFTKDRNVEAQTEIVSALNQIVIDSFGNVRLKRAAGELIFLPTGDGICIAMVDRRSPGWDYDAHIVTALRILQGVDRHNRQATEKKQFKVRIGINSSSDNLIIDINGNENLAGNGINMASRIMYQADGNQILVGPTVYDDLQSRARYEHSFRSYNAMVKHGKEISVHQFVAAAHPYLNTDEPAAFRRPEPALDELTAYYFAYSIRYQHLLVRLLEKLQCDSQSGVILFWLLALEATRRPDRSRMLHVSFDENALEEKLNAYSQLETGLKQALFVFITHDRLRLYEKNFEQHPRARYLLVNRHGSNKLHKENERIFFEFELESWRP